MIKDDGTHNVAYKKGFDFRARLFELGGAK
jgi:hypothetical protein